MVSDPNAAGQPDVGPASGRFEVPPPSPRPTSPAATGSASVPPSPTPAAVPPAPPEQPVASVPPPVGAEATPEQGVPLEVESAFVTAPTDTALEDQRERLRLLMDRGALVVLLVAVITLLAAVINALRGNFHITHWVFPVVAVALTAGLYFGAERMGKRPPRAVEVPADLSPVLNDLTIARGEVIATAPRVLNPDELAQVLNDAQERHKAAFDAAEETLKAIRAGDLERASVLGTEVYRHTETVEQIRDDLQREWESSSTVPEGYIGDLDDAPRPPTAPPPAPEPSYPATYSAEYVAQPEPGPETVPPADATRQFWSRPGSDSPPSVPTEPTQPPRYGMGRSGGSNRPAE